MNRLRLAIAQWLCPDLRDPAKVLSQRNEAVGLLAVIYDWTDHKYTPWARRTKILLEDVLGSEEEKLKGRAP